MKTKERRMQKRQIKFDLITVLQFLLISALSTQTSFGALGEGQMMLMTDVSYTSARELWKGNSDEVYFQDAAGTKHLDNTVVRGAKTQYMNLGVELAYGTQLWGIETSLRLDYTSSKIMNATHPNTANGAVGTEVNNLSGIKLKLAKDFYAGDWLTTGAYFEYKNPVESKPKSPSFIAVTDFSSHYTLGFRGQLYLSSFVLTYYDINYTVRSKASALKTEDIPGNQSTAKLDFIYAYDEKLSFGVGFGYRHTFKGADISTPAFGAAGAKAGHPPFYAARERFFGYSLYFNYYIKRDLWLGLSQFEKIWGRNTDRSETTSLFIGNYFKPLSHRFYTLLRINTPYSYTGSNIIQIDKLIYVYRFYM